MRRESDIVIIGAGIMGSSLAYFLSKKGKQVTVLEQGEICSGTSSSTAAWLFHSRKSAVRIRLPQSTTLHPAARSQTAPTH